MIVCVCRAVSDRVLAAAVDDGARTVDDVGRLCGAGTECGTCIPTVAAYVQSAASGGAGGSSGRGRATEPMPACVRSRGPVRRRD